MGDSENPFWDPNESTKPTSSPKKTSRFTTFVVPESNDDSIISTNYAQTRDSSTKIVRTPPYDDFFAAHSKSANRRNDGYAVPHKPEGQHYDDFETIDWVKDIACDRDRYRRIHSDKNTLLGKLRIYWNSASGWICVSLVGIAAGLIAALIDIGTPWLTDLKEGICLDALWFNRAQCCWSSDVPGEDCPEWYSWSRLMMNKDPSGENPSAYFVSYVVFVLWALAFSTLCVAFVRMFAPYACGSGIPEIKTILSGFIIRGYLGKWTLLVKSMGMVLGVSAGLSLGKEGPMVHMASCCGNILSYLFPKYSKNEAKKREILSAAAAAGVAVAFGAPIGGVLFSLEEASYYFPMKTMFRSFFCAMVSANLVRMINPYGDEHLVMFQIDYKAQWHIAELIPFAILGIMGGIFGTLFNRSNLFICRLRKTTWLGQYPVREVLLVTLATAVLSYPLPYMRMNMGDLVRLMVSRCGPGDLGALCDYKVNLSDTQATIMGNYPAGPGISRAMWMLAVTLFLKAIITVFTFGIKVPTGLFIPSLAVGAMMGRMLGVGIEQLVVHHADHPLVQRMCKSAHPCVNPGLYALVGAASTLGGVTRMTISLVVIMLELTGGLTYILPLMVAAMVSKWTGDRLTNGSIYEEHIRLNKYPYLSSREELIHTSIAADVMQPKTQTSPLLVVTQNSMTVGDIEFLLSSSTYKGFPVVVSEESQYLVGWITRRDLTRALEQEKLYNPDVATDSMVYFTDSNSAGDFGLPTNVANLSTIVDLSPITVTDQTPMETVLDFFRKLGLRQVLVTKNGRLLGIITKKDVLRQMNHH
nr:H():Cl() exchange transporter 3 [Hymenolepis microstoma]